MTPQFYIQVLQTINDIQLELNKEWVHLDDIHKRIQDTDITNTLIALVNIGALESPSQEAHEKGSDYRQFRLLGSSYKWEPKIPENYNIDRTLISEWFNKKWVRVKNNLTQ